MTASIAYIIPTRDRPEELTLTLAALARLKHPATVKAEVIIIDNASRVPPTPPERLRNGLPVRTIFLSDNQAAASRNIAAKSAAAQWLIMLDDDSAPLDTHFLEAIAEAPDSVAAIGAHITLPSGEHEAGGLPEVPIGCGVAIRRELFVSLGGYDPTFHFYAEEYDLAARILLAGFSVVHDPRFRVLHRKVTQGRDMNAILQRLVRNNGWIEQRYAPEHLRKNAIAHVIERYAAIARKENAQTGYDKGLKELRATLISQPRHEMHAELYDRFTGLAHARSHLTAELSRLGVRSVALSHPGKHAALVEQVLREQCISIVASEPAAEALVIATLSPGPMLNAMHNLTAAHAAAQPVICPWSFASERMIARATA